MEKLGKVPELVARIQEEAGLRANTDTSAGNLRQRVSQWQRNGEPTLQGIWEKIEEIPTERRDAITRSAWRELQDCREREAYREARPAGCECWGLGGPGQG